jgi:hypothetical protein
MGCVGYWQKLESTAIYFGQFCPPEVRPIFVAIKVSLESGWFFHVALQLSAPLDYPFSNSKRKSDDWTIDVFIFPLESQLRRLAVCESLSRSREADHHSHHTRNEIFVPVGNILPLILTADIKGQNL